MSVVSLKTVSENRQWKFLHFFSRKWYTIYYIKSSKCQIINWNKKENEKQTEKKKKMIKKEKYFFDVTMLVKSSTRR